MNTSKVTAEFKNWHYHIDNDNIFWLAIDRENKSANSLSKYTILELDAILDIVANNNDIRGLVIFSDKKSGFIAGADVTEFKKVEKVDDARVILQNGQNTLNKLEKLKIPTVAMIDGFCLGGGFELSLACDYRVASDSIKTKIGLPEVMLGIIPGWGGTYRFPKLVGGKQALPLMMQGKAVSAKAAKSIGMVDAVVPVRELKRAARYYIINKPSKHEPNFINSLVNQQPFRNIFAYFAKKELVKKIKKEHYPAPFTILENWQKYGVDNESNKVLTAEINADIELIQHPTARNLLDIFFVQEKLKEAAKHVDFEVKHVHVIGAGTMGGDIAAWCALKGYKVTLQDRDYKSLSNAISRAHKLYKKKLKNPTLAKLCMDKLIPDVHGYGVKQADVIIEAVFEDVKVKHEIFKNLELNAKKTAILATNTSSIPLDEINQVMTDKTRLVGIHFFNPVAKMMLVEVVKAQTTADDVVNKANFFVNKIGKLPLPVASSPGFLVNRVLSEYMHETFLLLTEGVSPVEIDRAMKNFGMPMGPVEMADIVGLDICLSVANNISIHYGVSVPKILQDKVAAKKLGKKTGEGFYKYKNGKKDKNSAKSINGDGVNNNIKTDITDRLVMRVLNVCVACLREKVVNEDYLVNAGLIFGAGFAPFRGGPMNYLYTLGPSKVLSILEKFTSLYGERFKPDTGFEQVLKQSGSVINNNFSSTSDTKNNKERGSYAEVSSK